MNCYRIAVLAGDGIGKEVMPEGIRVLDTVARAKGISLVWDHFDFASCDYYEAHGKMMPDDWKSQLEGYDAIYFGAVGWPDRVPDHISLWDSLIQFRRQFDQYVCLRPVKLIPGVPCPLAGRQVGDIDMLIVRENSEGEYSSIGGVQFEGTDNEVALQESVFTKRGTERIMRYAFDLAKKQGRKQVTSATKSNGIAISMPYWDARFEEISQEYPEIATNKYHIDILAAQFVMNPNRFDVVVASNLFGDILSDLGPACTGTIAIAPSANINPERTFPSLFEPVHGSAPDIYGKGIANPIGMIWSGAMMLEHLGEQDASDAVMKAIEDAIMSGTRTPDMGGSASTEEMGRSIAEAIV